MKRLLITGANGFIGQNILDIIDCSEYEVHSLSRTQKPNLTNIQWHSFDLLKDRVEIANLIKSLQPTHLLHLAWITTPGQYMTSLENYYWLQSSIDLIMEFAINGGKRLVVAGTCCEYDRSYGHLIEDKTPLIYDYSYPSSKNLLNLFLRSYSRSMDLSYAWGRVFFPYGPYENSGRLIPDIISSIINKKTISCTAGEQRLDFIYALDIASLFLKLLESDIQGDFNIGTGNAFSLKEVVRHIIHLIGGEEYVRLGERPYRESEYMLVEASSIKLNKELRWSPQYNMFIGLAKTIAWWQQQLS